MKPSDLFLGLFEFFAIVLPGAILMYLLLLPEWPSVVVERVARPLAESGASWVAFGVAAYTLGHLLHFLGGFLDWRYYDPDYRRRRRFKAAGREGPRIPGRGRREVERAKKALDEAKHRLKANDNGENKKAVEDLQNDLACLTLSVEDRDGPPTEYQLRVKDIIEGKTRTDGEPKAADKSKVFELPASENLYTWVTATLRVRNPAVAAELERAGVDSKFFRSLVLVSAFAAVWLPAILLLPPLGQTDVRSGGIFWGCVGFAALCWLSFEWSWERFWRLAVVWVIAAVVVTIATWGLTDWPTGTPTALWACSLSLLLCRLSYERYCQRRWEASEAAYRYFVIQSLSPPAAPPAATASSG